MILILEIILTISAWRKGWKGWALLPMGICLSVGFLIGMAVGASGGTMEDVLPLCVFIELAALISLIVMVAKAPKHIEKVQTTQAVKLTT